MKTARLSHPSGAPANDCAGSAGRIRRRDPGYAGSLAKAERDRQIHGGGGLVFRLSQGRAVGRYERGSPAATGVLRKKRFPKRKRRKTRLGACRRLSPARKRLRLQSGVDGFRRDALHGAEAALSGLPNARLLPRLSGLHVTTRRKAVRHLQGV